MRNPDPSGIPQAEPAAELYAAALEENALLDRLIAGEFNDLLSRVGTSYDSTADAGDVSVVLARVLAAWPRDVNSEPIPDLVDADTANEAIRAAIDEGRQEPNAVFRGIAYALLVVLPLWVIAALLVIWLVTR